MAGQVRQKMSSATYVASRARDPIFEKLMDQYKHLYKVLPIEDLILSDPSASSPSSASVSLDLISHLSHSLHLYRGPSSFLRKFPHIFTLFPHPTTGIPHCSLKETVIDLARMEEEAKEASIPLVVDRLTRLLSMSTTNTVPLHALEKVYRELGLPFDYRESVISAHPDSFRLHDGELVLLKRPTLVPSVDNWRVIQYCTGDLNVDASRFKYCFKHGFPPGMHLSKEFKRRVKAWQSFPYVGPYEEAPMKRNRGGREKRAVAMVHEFLSFTVEKMVEVERISHFRKCFGIDFNIRDLFLDHPGMFYLSTKGKTHTVFLREAYERGRLIDPDPVYEVRRKLLDLIQLGRHDMIQSHAESRSRKIMEFEQVDGIANESKLEELDNHQSDKDG